MYVAMHTNNFALHKFDMIWVFIGHARGWAPPSCLGRVIQYGATGISVAVAWAHTVSTRCEGSL
jgi:hypothetical protein